MAITGDQITAVVGLIAIVGALVGLRRWSRPKLGKFWRDLIAIRDMWLGRDAVLDSITREEISPALPSIGVQMAQTKGQLEFAIAKLHAIEHEVTNNDGSSVKDSVDRIEERLRTGDERFQRIEAALSTMAEAQPALYSALEAIAKASPPELERPDLD